MTCRTCGGLVIDHYDESKCINCGRSPNAPTAAPVIEQEMMMSESEVGKRAWTPERRAKFIATMARRRKALKGGGSTAMVPARPTMPVRRSAQTIDAEIGPVADLNTAIVRLREDLRVLEQARTIVERVTSMEVEG